MDNGQESAAPSDHWPKSNKAGMAVGAVFVCNPLLYVSESSCAVRLALCVPAQPRLIHIPGMCFALSLISNTKPAPVLVFPNALELGGQWIPGKSFGAGEEQESTLREQRSTFNSEALGSPPGDVRGKGRIDCLPGAL